MKLCGTDIRVQGRLLRIARPELDKYEAMKNPDAVLEALRNCGIWIDLFTFMQQVFEPSPRYAFHMEWDNVAALPVSTFENWWKHQIRSLARNRARQAEKRGVTLRELPFDDTLARGIREIYNESPVRQGKANVHYGKDLETVRNEAATFLDRSTFIGAFFEESLIGFVKLVTDESRTQANLMNIVSMIKHRDKAPTNALIARSVRCCAERGIPYLLYQSFSGRSSVPDSLDAFKEANGFRRVDVPRYYIPLTPVGRAALRLRLHRRLVDRIPEPVAARLRELRSGWNGRKLLSQGNALR